MHFTLSFRSTVFIFAFLLLSFLTRSVCGIDTSPFIPPALPLAVKTPYLNYWSPQGNDPRALNDVWANIWDVNAGGQNQSVNAVSAPTLKNNITFELTRISHLTKMTGWMATVTVDGHPYGLHGFSNNADAYLPQAVQSSYEFTATRTSAIFNVENMQVNLSFITPIEVSKILLLELDITTYTSLFTKA